MNEKISPPEITELNLLLDYKNPDLPVGERVADLLSRMTLEEKVAQMLCVWRQRETFLVDQSSAINVTNLKRHYKEGIGQIARLSDIGEGLTATEMAKLANSLQRFFVEETRLGIPVIFHEECLHGLPAVDATSYPQPIALASTFNPDLIEEIYTAIAIDARRRGAHQALTPVVDVVRDPRWGRVEETFGEDPFLVAKLGIAAVKGFQGDGAYLDKKHVLATLKHFAAHGQPESGSNCGPADFSERLLRDVFLYPFRQLVEKCPPASIMASYNEIDGLPSHANQWLLRKVLREEWQFKGFVVSDYFAITELFHKEDSISHGLARNKTEAALLAAKAGVNIELPDIDCYPNLVQLVNDGRLREQVIDELIAPMLTYKFTLGLFEDPYVDPDLIQNENKLKSDRKLAVRSAREAITLLKNQNNLLPLDPNEKRTIAVIGPNAERELLGGYSGKPWHFITVLEGIKHKVGEQVTVLHSEGCQITVNGSWQDDAVTLPDPEEDRKSIEQAVATASSSDIIILVLGGNEQTSREAWSKFHMGDRPCLELFGAQNDLAKAMVATGKPIVVLLFNGRPNSINYIQENIPAILECWYLGQEAGQAVADILFGDYNPSGKLPISIPRSAGHIPCFYNHKPSARRGYLFDDITPLFPFGFGLSYTTFEFTNLRLAKNTIQSSESTEVRVNITNTGKRSGTEVVQMYIRDCHSSVTRPIKELRGFKKIHLAAWESKTVTLPITPEHLAFTNIENQYVVEPGDFEIMVGNSSRDADLLKTVLQVI
ncbi:glycoside hydrolase family 3 C-terminal domain-containing protein [candidate division KSB1 bacterium]|nr:glycoside hydrolase family 3 C-terminal domain-containing protein [candidate division KSB1 bacterium]